MPSLDYRRLRASVGMRQVLELIQFEPRQRSGNEWRGPCPLHGSTSERSRSFAANVRKDTFRCFKCGAAGNQLDLWSQLCKLPLYAAALDLCRAAAIDPPLLASRSPPRPEAESAQRNDPALGSNKKSRLTP